MKRTAAVILLFTLVLSASVASFAQASRSVRGPLPASDFVIFQSISSYTDGQGVLIRWQMVSETHNVGFYIYRIGQDGPELVNPTIVGGNATRSLNPTGTDTSYEYYDRNGVFGTLYYIQSRCADGRRLSTAQFSPKFTNDFEQTTGHPKQYYEDLAANHNGELQSRGMKLPQSLQTIVDAAMLPPDPTTQHWVASQPGAKIAVKQEGMYRVTRAELQNAGFNVNSDPANWRLFQEGNEQAINVDPAGQYIEFYGRSLDTAESDTRMYYLIADVTPGRRIQTRVLLNRGGNVVSNSYAASAVRQERTQYFPNVLNGSEQNYFGTLISDDHATIPNPNDPHYVPYVLSNIDTSVPTASVIVRLQGSGVITGSHHVHVTLNGTELGIIDFGNIENVAVTFTVPTSILIEGPNFFELHATNGNDFSYFDSVTVNYGRRYVSENNKLSFYAPGLRKENVGNFATPNVRVFDTTYDANTQLLINFPVVNVGGTFTVQLPSDRAAVMYAVEDSGLLQSPSVTFNTPSSLSAAFNSADILIISHSASDFMAAAETWAAYRRSPEGGNFVVKVIDVADIFDEFNYGVASSNCITNFFEYTKSNWQSPRPRYVLLLGDASYDPRNYEGFGNWNLIPSKMVDLVFGESPSDEALADFDHNSSANIPIGRIPARVSASITTVFNKTTHFETAGQQDLHVRGAVCAADLPLGFDFEAMCSIIQGHMPAGTPFTLVRRGLPPPNPQNLPDPQAHANLMAALNPGPYIANYSGHGSTGVWAASSFFSSSDVPSLTNAGNESIYTMLTCLNGYFVLPQSASIAELLLTSPNGGAAVAWASSADTTPDLQLIMADRFYQQIPLGTIKRMGDLVSDAKNGLPAGSDVGYSWTLLGDPAMQVHQ